MKLRSLPFHPFLIVLFQLFALYAVNVNMAVAGDVLSVSLIALACTACCFFLLLAITRNSGQSAVLVTLYCFLFFSYGRLLDIVPGLALGGLVIGRNKYLLPLYALTGILATLWVFRSRWCKKHLPDITHALNVFGIVLVLVSVVVAITNVDRSTWGGKKKAEPAGSGGAKEGQQALQGRRNNLRPNVYFVIFDSYASYRVLKKYYGWDDSSVVNGLRARGFVVNTEAHSNYPFTMLSLGSTLNMHYIHKETEFVDARSKGAYLTFHIKNNKVVERFKSEGYDVVFRRVHSQEENIRRVYETVLANRFWDLVVNISILRVIEDELMAEGRRNRILDQIEDITRPNKTEKPIFLFSHILCPHPPYLFNFDGSKAGLMASAWGRVENRKGYINQVRFMGTQIVKVADALRNSDPTAVIVLQADHGHGYILGDLLLDRNKPPRDFLDAQYGNLSAIYLPPGITMPEAITPVNLFRYLFNGLFDAGLEILPDRAFFTPIKEPYIFYDVTDDLNSLTPLPS